MVDPRRARGILLAVACCAAWASAAAAQESDEPADRDNTATLFPEHGTDRIWLSGQINVIFQHHDAFPARYSGEQSFRASAEHATSTLLTLFTGLRLGDATEILFDVESAGGRGISDALGLAGFTDLDVVRNPSLGGAPYLARLMVHQTIALGRDRTDAEPTALALARRVPVRRLEFRIGKFGTADFFDVNTAGSDSHLQFENWTVDNNGAYDYAADTRGYTWGAIVELDDRRWALRFGEMLMPKVANGLELDWDLGRARAENLELELRTGATPRSGAIRLLAYMNHANMGDYREAIRRARGGVDARPSIETTRVQGRRKYGVGVNAEQPLTGSLRAFARWGWNEPHHESFAYTEVNDSVEVGAALNGDLWHRDNDKAGVAFVSDGISPDHQRYLALGGSGFLLGDGALTYGREAIVETYYTARLWRGISASVDVQHITHPGYNRDRGPVLVTGARLHVDF